MKLETLLILRCAGDGHDEVEEVRNASRRGASAEGDGGDERGSDAGANGMTDADAPVLCGIHGGGDRRRWGWGRCMGEEDGGRKKEEAFSEKEASFRLPEDGIIPGLDQGGMTEAFHGSGGK